MVKNKQNYKLLVNNSYMLLANVLLFVIGKFLFNNGYMILANGLIYLMNVRKLIMLK